MWRVVARTIRNVTEAMDEHKDSPDHVHALVLEPRL